MALQDEYLLARYDLLCAACSSVSEEELVKLFGKKEAARLVDLLYKRSVRECLDRSGKYKQALRASICNAT